MYDRALSVLTATLAAMALAAAPALAGEDDDGDDDDTDSSQVQQAPAPAPASGDTSSSAPAPASATPQGGVATGLGGTAPRDHDGLLVLGSGVLLLAGTGGGLVAVRRRAS